MSGRGFWNKHAGTGQAASPPAQVPRTDRDAYELFFPGKPGGGVAQFAAYNALVQTLGQTLEERFRSAWVAWETACYWTPGNRDAYALPSLFVAAGGRPPEPTQSYRRWEHGQLLFVVEVASQRTLSNERGPHLRRYEEGLTPCEHLYFDPARDALRLHRRMGDAYVEAPPDPLGWIYSEQLMLWFAAEGRGQLRMYDRDRNRLLSRTEADARRQESARAESVATARRLRQDQVDAAVAQRRTEVQARLASLETEVGRRRTEARLFSVPPSGPALRLPGLRQVAPQADDDVAAAPR